MTCKKKTLSESFPAEVCSALLVLFLVLGYIPSIETSHSWTHTMLTDFKCHPQICLNFDRSNQFRLEGGGCLVKINASEFSKPGMWEKRRRRTSVLSRVQQIRNRLASASLDAKNAACSFSAQCFNEGTGFRGKLRVRAPKANLVKIWDNLKHWYLSLERNATYYIYFFGGEPIQCMQFSTPQTLPSVIYCLFFLGSFHTWSYIWCLNCLLPHTDSLFQVCTLHSGS